MKGHVTQEPRNKR